MPLPPTPMSSSWPRRSPTIPSPRCRSTSSASRSPPAHSRSDLVENRDVVAGLVAARRSDQTIVAFAAETVDSEEELLERARAKAARKRASIFSPRTPWVDTWLRVRRQRPHDRGAGRRGGLRGIRDEGRHRARASSTPCGDASALTGRARAGTRPDRRGSWSAPRIRPRPWRRRARRGSRPARCAWCSRRGCGEPDDSVGVEDEDGRETGCAPWHRHCCRPRRIRGRYAPTGRRCSARSRSRTAPRARSRDRRAR